MLDCVPWIYVYIGFGCAAGDTCGIAVQLVAYIFHQYDFDPGHLFYCDWIAESELRRVIKSGIAGQLFQLYGKSVESFASQLRESRLLLIYGQQPNEYELFHFPVSHSLK